MNEPVRKTAVFLCRCGPNIADFLDLDALAAWAQARDDVEFVDSHELYCAPDGKRAFQDALSGKELQGVVVAACTPKMHEKTFQALAEEAGLNRGQVQLANIREHCAWVTPDRDRATRKARALIDAAIRRAVEAERLEQRTMEVQTDLLVIGGGVAGLEAALTAARAGRKVYLVDRDISIGGAVVKTEEVAPVMECGPCVIAPLLATVKEEPNIEVITNAEVTQILGFYGNFRATVRQHPRYVEDSCIGCELCFEVCPVDVDSPFQHRLGTWKAIHTLFPGSVPAAAAIDAESCLHFVDGSCDACVPVCPFQSINFDDREQEREIEVGAVILATGFSPADVSQVQGLAHGRHPEVYTLPEFERIVSSNGPYGGALKRRDGSQPASIAVVHCAGSLCEGGLPYCSSVCCVNAIKVGELARQKNPDVEVHNIHGRLVLPGPHAQRLYDRAKDAGTRFLHTEALAQVTVEPGEATLRLSGGGVDPLEVEMVVLANGMTPSAGSQRLAELLHLERDADGYPITDNDLLHPTASVIAGVYLAGCAAGPCDVATAVTRGRAAVADAISRLMPGRTIDLEVMTSSIDAEVCGGCKMCIAVCPYHAIAFDPEEQVCQVQEAMCRGCGTCAASCPTGACGAKNYSNAQLLAEIGGLLDG